VLAIAIWGPCRPEAGILLATTFPLRNAEQRDRQCFKSRKKERARSGEKAHSAWKAAVQEHGRVPGEGSFRSVERMTIQRMDHVGIVFDDIVAATEFFVELGLKLEGEGQVEGGWVDRVVGLEGVRAELAMMETPDGHGRLELIKFHAPPGPGGDRHAPANTPGIRHLTFAVDDIDAIVAGLRARGAELVGEVENYEGIYRLCYVRGPEGIIVELAEQIG
jgi:catechol 2,3-dioxygenase-like lactoylglutathione lyase family enzyme